MSDSPLMPKATAVWLVENTKISFKQIADFCNLHELEVKGIADGDVAKGIKAYNPILAGQLTRDEIEKASTDVNKSLILNKKKLNISSNPKKKTQKYIPLSKRQDRPDAVVWLIKNFPQLGDNQIAKLIGSTKNTVSLIRNKNYWNISNLSPKDPVVSNLCYQIDKKNAAEKDDKKIARKKKEIEKKNKKIPKELDISNEK